MKLFALSVLVVGMTVEARTQTLDSGQSLIKNKCAFIRISLPQPRKETNDRAVFKDIEVVDARNDTSRLGLINIRFNRQAEVVFHVSPKKAVTDFLNAAYRNPRGSYSLLVLMKDMWISDSLSFRYEAYLKNDDGYVPLTYLDTLMRVSSFNMTSVAANDLPFAISLFMERVTAIDLDIVPVLKKTISFAAIDLSAGPVSIIPWTQPVNS
jgi:hypothetical protein